MASLKPLEDFGHHVVAMANKPDSNNQRCALQWLEQWAHGTAMLGQMSSGFAFTSANGCSQNSARSPTKWIVRAALQPTICSPQNRW
jgi:hypothetical protein